MESHTTSQASIPPPPRAVSALIKGFNAIANHVLVILFPVIFDTFFWLGPRLKANALLAPIMEALPDIRSQAPAEQAKLFTQFSTDLQSGLNLFSVLRTFPMGVSSLVSSNLSTKAPWGIRPGVDLPNWLAAFGAMMFLTFLGWLLGSMYFRSVSRVALDLQEGPGVFRALLHGVLLSGVWLSFFFLANLPFLIVVWLMTMLGSVLRTLLFILISIPTVWVLLAIYYSFYGVFTEAQNAFASTRTSIWMLRYGLPPLGWFTMLVIIISQGMDLLWRVAPTDSWMMGVGIFGHAFVSTSLLAASFIYFRDLKIWIETVQQWIKKQSKPSAQV